MNSLNRESAINTAIELSERIEVLSKVAIEGHESHDVGDLMLSSADAFVAICMIIETARNQKSILSSIETTGVAA